MANVVLNLTGAQLNALLDHLNEGGVPNAPDFAYEQTEEGLLLKQGGNIIARQHQDGTWISESVSTGVGSFHLGEAHSVSSCGQNVGFMNEYDAVTDALKVFWFPVWQGISKDGGSVSEPTALRFNAFTWVDVNGLPSAVRTDIPYNFTTTITSNMAVFKVTVIPGEDYTGKLKNKILSGGAEIYSSTIDAVCIRAQTLEIEYKYPFFTRSGDALTLQLIKEDGTYLKTACGASNTNVPYRKLHGRTFTDMSLLPAIDGSQADSGVVISSADKFVHNDNGTMKQTSFSRLLDFVYSNANGSAGPTLTNNLTADRAVVTGSNSKFAVAAATSTEVGYLSGASSNIQTQINNIRNKSIVAYGSYTASTEFWVCSTGNIEVRASANGWKIVNSTGSTHQFDWTKMTSTGVTTGESSVPNGSNWSTTIPSNNQSEYFHIGVNGSSFSGIITVKVVKDGSPAALRLYVTMQRI